MKILKSLMIVSLLYGGAFAAENGNWPGFRGENARGVAEGHELPVNWNVASGENILWKSPVPGLGHASPAIWGDRIFVLTAVGEREQSLKVGLYGQIAPVQEVGAFKYQILCFNKKTGKKLWEKTAYEGVPKVKRHTKATHANSSPATDGKHVVAFYGSEGLYCFDMDGNLLWKKDFGLLDSGFFAVPGAQWGFGSSPLIHDGVLYIQCDVQKDSFVAAFNVADGKQLWKTPREEVPTWGTPTLMEANGKMQLVANGFKHIGGYDAKTGEELWKLVGGGDIPTPTPVVGHDLVFITNAHGQMSPIYAIKNNASGTISLEDEGPDKAIKWSITNGGAYMQTPLVYGDYLYNCRDSGVLTCFKAATGEEVYKQRLARGEGFTASVVAGDGKLYYTGEEGNVFVLKAGPEYELLATNTMDEVCMATPAISEGVIFFRTRGNLVAVGKK